MKSLVLYESMFGHTEAVARAVAAGISSALPDGSRVEIADVSAHPLPRGVGLLVTGAPTHAFGMSRPATRADAARQGTVRPGAVEAGLREWLDGLTGLDDVAVAAFDTRVAGALFTGSAARKALRSLHRLGGEPVLAAEGFLVTGTRGPLAPGELDRAREWGARLARAVSASSPAPAA
jgi:hypothetical protein